MTEQEQIARANAARRLLDDPLMAEAWSTVERAITEKFRSGDLTDEDLKRLWLSLLMLQKVKSWVEGVVQTGNMAEISLKLKEIP